MKFPIYYDRQGKPIEGGTIAWAKMLESEDRHVAQTKTCLGLIWVSTVWLGLDHDFSWGMHSGNLDEPNPHPIIFETMVFFKTGVSGRQWRYSTEAEARAGHKAAVKLMRNPINAFKMWREYRS